MKLAREMGIDKAAKKLEVPKETLSGRQKAVKEGRLDIGARFHTPQMIEPFPVEWTAKSEKKRNETQDISVVLAQAA